MEQKKRRYYSLEFKLKVVREVLEGKYSKESAQRAYGIKGKSAVLYWIRKYAEGYPSHKSIVESISDKKTRIQMKELSEKDKRIIALEKELERERVRADLWEEIVKQAEERLHIDISKKYGAKPSTPLKNKKAKK